MKSSPNDPAARNPGRPYQICSKTVMDTSDPDIVFDDEGVSNHVRAYEMMVKSHVKHGAEAKLALEAAARTIREGGAKARYDCILGLSGGVDSTYLCLVAKELGLRPLVVHFDNGWNSELAVQNIASAVETLGFDLYTHVVDWEEFRELQRSYFAADVVDIEVLTDHGFMSALYQQAAKHRIRVILAGMNVVTEGIMAASWNYDKSDLVNLANIQRVHGTRPLGALKSFPSMSRVRRALIERALGLTVFEPLNYLDYRYDEVKARIAAELGWRDYGGKHYESVFTRFYQGAILPKKFGIDKRRAHYSTLICSGQMSRDEALKRLEQPSLPPDLEARDREYLLKKLGFSEGEFADYLARPPRSHAEYGSSRTLLQMVPFLRMLAPVYERLFPRRGMGR